MSAPTTPAEPAEPAGLPTDDDLIREYAQLTRDNRAMDAQKRINSERIRTIEQRVLDIYEARGQRAVDLVGLGNLHTKRYLSVKIVRDDGDYDRDVTNAERDRAAAALEAAGLTDLLKRGFNLNQVRARYNEWDKDKTHPPEPLADAFHVEAGYTLELTT